MVRMKTGEQPEVRNASGVIITPWTITYSQDSYPSSIVLFRGSELATLKGDTTPITGSFEDTITTNPAYRTQGIYASLQYLEAPFNIRVSKSVISNAAG